MAISGINFMSKTEYSQNKTPRAKRAQQLYGENGYSQYVNAEQSAAKRGVSSPIETGKNYGTKTQQKSDYFESQVQQAKKTRSAAELEYAMMVRRAQKNIMQAQIDNGGVPLTDMQKLSIYKMTCDNAAKLCENFSKAKQDEEFAVKNAFFNATDNLQHFNYLA